MKWIPAFLCTAVVFASPVVAAPSVAPSLDPVAHAISDVLREQGIEEARAAELAQRIVDRLLADGASATPKLQ